MAEYCLSSQKGRVMEIELIDTDSSVYTVVDERLAEELCEKLGIKPMPLLKPCSVKGFNGKLINWPITHAIYLRLTVNEHSELTAPMLITRLGSHRIILGKPWLNRHKVVLNMGSDQLIFSAEQCKEFGCTTNFMVPQIKLTPAKKIEISKTSQHTILKRQKTSEQTVPLPSVPVKSINKKSTVAPWSDTVTKPLDIALIGAAAFSRLNTRKQH